MGNISYSAVVLDDKSHRKLMDKFKNIIPQDWKVYAHHMTINMGELEPELKKFLGLPVRLIVNDMAIDDKVLAVGVEGFYSKNKKPHITLAVNINNGGKPRMSNDLTNWKKINKPLYLTGHVKEIQY